MSKLKNATTKYPLLRGMLSYSLIWPTSALIQQAIAGKNFGKRLANTIGVYLLLILYNDRHNRLGKMCAIQLVRCFVCGAHLIRMDQSLNSHVATRIASQWSN